MKEKDIVNYAINALNTEFGIAVHNYTFKGSECDFLCVNQFAETIEVEHKGAYYTLYDEFNKTIKGGDVGSKHKSVNDGERTNYFYFLIPARLYLKYKNRIPQQYGIMSYEAHEHSTSLLSLTIVRNSKKFHNKKIKNVELYNIAASTDRYINTPTLPKNEKYIGMLSEDCRRVNRFTSECLNPKNFL